MYEKGQYVNCVAHACLAQIVRVHKSIGTLNRYDLLTDDGHTLTYVDEMQIYPALQHATRDVPDDTYMAFQRGAPVAVPHWNGITGVVKGVSMLVEPLGTGKDFLYTVELSNGNVFDFFTCELVNG